MTEYTIAYDCERKQPGCVLIQAAMSATIPNYVLMKHFDTSDWLLTPTDDMAVYPITDDQLPILAAKTRNRDG